MNRKQFLSLTLSAALVLAGSLANPSLGAMGPYQGSEEETDEQEQQHPRPRERRAQREEMLTYNSNDVANYLDNAVLAKVGTKPAPGPLPEQRTRRVCQALDSYLPLYWRGTTLTPGEVRRAFSLEADSHITCEVGNHTNRLTILEDIGHRANRSEEVQPSPDDPTKEHQHGALIDRLDDAAIAVDRNFGRVGLPLDDQDETGICNAVRQAHDLDWRGVSLSPSQVRTALSLEATTRVACHQDEHKITFAQTQPQTPTPRAETREFTPLEVVQRLWNAIKPGRGDRIRSNPNISSEHREELCQAFQNNQPLSWGPKDLTPTEVRTAFGIQPNTQVQCSFRSGALHLTEATGPQASPLPAPPATETKETNYSRVEVYNRLYEMASSFPANDRGLGALGPGLLAPISDPQKAAICTALREDRDLTWMNVDLKPRHLRRALSLQPYSMVACSFDQAGMKVVETGFVPRSAPSHSDPARLMQNHFGLEPIGENLADIAAILPSQVQTTGIRWTEKRKIALCRALETQSSLLWHQDTLSQAELRRGFSLPLASSDVRCSYDGNVLTLTEVRPLSAANPAETSR